MLIWDYSLFSSSWMVNLFVHTSNAEALSVFLNVPYGRAALLVCAGLLAKLLMQLVLHLALPGVPLWLIF